MSGLTWMWLLIAVLLGVVEVATGTLMALLFAVAALVTALVAQLGFGLNAQLGVFLIGTLAAVAAAPGLVRRINRHSRRAERFGPDALIDKVGLVTEAIDPIAGSGAIRVAGALWRASAHEAIPAGRQVRVMEIRGTSAVVWPLAESAERLAGEPTRNVTVDDA